jgi:hypothetical protein
LGHPGKYTWCMAEDMEVSPWEPLHVERGLSANESAVTIFAALSGVQVANHESRSPRKILTSFQDGMFAIGARHGELNIVLCPEHIGHFRAAGWSKDQVKQALFEIAQRTDAEWRAAGEVLPESDDSDRMVPTASKPENINVLVAGGAAGAFSSIIPLWTAGNGTRSVTKRIQF